MLLQYLPLSVLAGSLLEVFTRDLSLPVIQASTVLSYPLGRNLSSAIVTDVIIFKGFIVFRSSGSTTIREQNKLASRFMHNCASASSGSADAAQPAFSFQDL